MPSIRTLLPAALAVALLAGCGGGLAGLRTADHANTPTDRSPSSVARPTGIPVGSEGDSPPPGSPTTLPVQTGSPTVPGACSLVSKEDLEDLVQSTPIRLVFGANPEEKTWYDQLFGWQSSCHWTFESHFTSTDGIDIVGAVVNVKVLSDGAVSYFPTQNPYDIPVDGIGDAAFLRNSTLYVEIGAAVLVLEVGIPNRAVGTPEDQRQEDIAWEKQLAATLIIRLGWAPH